MKAFKIIAVVVLVLIIGLVGIIFFTVSQFDNLVKQGIQRGGTYALGVQTTVDSVNVGLFEGTFAMSGLRIANPEGYTAKDRFLSVGEGDVSLDTGSIRQEVIRLPTLNLTDVQLNLLKEKGKSNYDVIMDNLGRFESKDDKTPPGQEGGGQKYVIDRVVVRNVDVYAAMLPVGGDLTAAQVNIDEIVLTDVGEPSGVKSAEVINIVIKGLLSAVLNKAGSLPGDIVGELESGLKDLQSLGELGVGVAAEGANIIGSVGGEAGKAVQDAAEEGGKAIEDVGKGIEDVGKGIGDLLGGNKDKEDDDNGNGNGGN